MKTMPCGCFPPKNNRPHRHRLYGNCRQNCLHSTHDHCEFWLSSGGTLTGKTSDGTLVESCLRLTLETQVPTDANKFPCSQLVCTLPVGDVHLLNVLTYRPPSCSAQTVTKLAHLASQAR